MPKRQFIRSRRAWYDAVNRSRSDSEEFILGFCFDDDPGPDVALCGQVALRYHPGISGWRLEALAEDLGLAPHFIDVFVAMAFHGTKYSGDDLEKLLLECGVLDKTPHEPESMISQRQPPKP